MKKVLRSQLVLHPFFMDVGLTAATEFIGLLVGLLIVSLFGRMLGAVALGEYLLLRRVAAWLQSGAQLGLWVALPRYVAHVSAEPGTEGESYFFAAFACVSAVVVLLGIVLNAARGHLALWLFGSPQMTHLIFPLSLMLPGLAAHAEVYGYYRGRLAMKRANALQICAVGLVPLLAILTLFRAHSVARIVSAMGILMLLCALLFGAPIAHRLLRLKTLRFVSHASDLLRYGVPRMPGDLAAGALFTLGPTIASHYVPMSRVTYFLLGLMILSGVSSAAQPLSMVLLSKTSMMLAQERSQEVRAHLGLLAAAALETGIFACLQLVVFADALVRLWVGPTFVEGTIVIRIIILALPFYMLYAVLQSTIDAASVTAFNTRNICISLALFLALVGLESFVLPAKLMLEGIAGALLGALVVLAWLTGRTLRRVFDLDLGGILAQSAGPLLVSVLLACISFLIYSKLGFRIGIIGLVLLEAALCICFLWLVTQLGSRWLPFLWRTAFAGGATVRSATGSDAMSGVERTL